MSASILGYDEDTNIIFLSTDVGDFLVQLDSSEFRNVPRIEQNYPMACYPYSNFYSPGNISSLPCVSNKNAIASFS
jgi:hypothetical protein